jgi:hypothetical protein
VGRVPGAPEEEYPRYHRFRRTNWASLESRSEGGRVNIGRPKRIIEIQPETLPVPEFLPDPLPEGIPEPTPASPEPVEPPGGDR